MDYAQMTDGDVLTAYYNCDDAAWNMLEQRWRLRYLKALLIPGYLRGVRPLSRMPMRAVKANDCVAEAMVKICLSKGKKDRWDPGRGSVHTYVKMKLRHAILDLLGEKEAWIVTTSDIKGREDDEEDQPPSVVEPPPPKPDGGIDWWNLMLQALRECVASLPEEWQRICNMRFKEGKKQEQIAKECKVSVSTVNRWLSDDIEPQLRACLKEKGVELPGTESEER